MEEWTALPAFLKTPVEGLLNGLPHATLEREDARQYLVGLEEYYTHFRRSALKAFAPDTDWDHGKLKQYDAYLQTVLTNAVLDMTLSHAAGQNDPAPGLAIDKAIPEKDIAKPFELKIAEAQAFLDYLRAERGNAPDATKLTDTKFAAFESDGDAQNLKPYLKIAKKLQQAPKPGKDLEAAEIADIDAALETNSNDATTLQRLLPGLRADYPRRDEVITRFNDAATELMAEDIPKEKKEAALIALQGTAAYKEEMRDMLLKEFQAIPLAEDAQKIRKQPNVYAPEILNDLVDRALIDALQLKFKEIVAVKIDDVQTHPDRGVWEQDLLKMYKAAETPKVRDTISQALEYVKYQLKHNGDADPISGKTGYAKYLEYLESNKVDKKDFPPENAWVNSSAHSKERMKKNLNVSETWLKASSGTSLSNFFLGESLEDKIIILKNEYHIAP